MSKVTRKSYKRKKIIMGAVLFGAIGLVSVGFAAWVLSASATKEQGAQMNVGTVEDQSMQFGNVLVYETGDSTKASVNVFKFDGDPADSTGRLRYGDDGSAERLSLTVESTISSANNLGTLTARLVYDQGGSTVELEGSQPKYENGLVEAIAKGYIVAPACYNTEFAVYNSVTDVKGADCTYSLSGTNATFTIKVEFGWGAFFNNVNPSIFYDSEDLNSENVKGVDYTVEQLNDTLDELHTLLDSLKLKLILTANPN